MYGLVRQPPLKIDIFRHAIRNRLLVCDGSPKDKHREMKQPPKYVYVHQNPVRRIGRAVVISGDRREREFEQTNFSRAFFSRRWAWKVACLVTYTDIGESSGPV